MKQILINNKIYIDILDFLIKIDHLKLIILSLFVVLLAYTIRPIIMYFVQALLKKLGLLNGNKYDNIRISKKTKNKKK